jgi:proline dehydrogenase
VSAFIPLARGAFLYLSRQPRLRKWIETSPAARRFTSRFIAGMTLEDALRAARGLKAISTSASLDHLGENVTTIEEANAARDAYLAALDQIAAEKLGATVSMKVTSLGLDIDERVCFENTGAVVQRARDTGTRVEFDMEDTGYTDRNLRLVHAMHERYGSVRAVIQAYLYRSEKDIELLCERGVPVRLCKGAYREPATVAWPDKGDVDANYVKLMRILFDKGAYPAIATHDRAMIGEAISYAKKRVIRPGQFEFQMLYGVARSLQRRVVEQGYRLRVYVPYGKAWYPYFMRRLAERPANVWFVAKNVIGG